MRLLFQSIKKTKKILSELYGKTDSWILEIPMKS
jgi:hypothetical protein